MDKFNFYEEKQEEQPQCKNITCSFNAGEYYGCMSDKCIFEPDEYKLEHINRTIKQCQIY